MNREKPNWAALVKASSVGRDVFTEQMKQTVLTRVEQNQRKKLKIPFIYMTAPLAGLLICLLLFPVFDSLPAVFQTMEKSIMGANGTSSEDIALHYEPAKELSAIPDTDKGIRGYTLSRLPLTSVHVKETVSIEGIGKYMDYIKSDEDSISYFGFQIFNHPGSTEDEFYEIGYGKMSEAKLQKSDAFGLMDLRLDGKCGPERRCVYWIALNQDEVVAYEQMDAWTIYEQDLDKDGVTEVVASTYAKEIYIYKNIKGQIQSVDVQAALKAGYGDAVTYNPDNQVFQITGKGGTKKYRYVTGADMFRQVHE
ncbi:MULTISPECIES: hypothetical protein [unclassified Paenibacillus]|uniref:hypothetical protein n=1 Tax=unclassified Paenibacillus TaxID=185978 RepID=UPI0002DC90E7|nr:MULTISPECIES: hypothetical protein [unclassified Paenibacillus]EPD85983.1 hypothetical protein HMPREF1207_02938 [Paenibacillus sp. HGH0039]